MVDILDFLRVVLEAEGYEFAGAASAEEALEVYKKTSPDLVIVDLMMEEVDAGTGFAKDLRLLRNEAPVFMLSSVGDSLSSTTDYVDLGLAGIFQKPLARDHLLSVLKTTLARTAV